MHVMNMVLYASGMCLNFGLHIVVRCVKWDEPGFFTGYGSWGACMVILSNVFIGLAMTAVYKCVYSAILNTGSELLISLKYRCRRYYQMLCHSNFDRDSPLRFTNTLQRFAVLSRIARDLRRFHSNLVIYAGYPTKANCSNGHCSNQPLRISFPSGDFSPRILGKGTHPNIRTQGDKIKIFLGPLPSSRSQYRNRSYNDHNRISKFHQLSERPSFQPPSPDLWWC
jgi:hypothetical protein